MLYRSRLKNDMVLIKLQPSEIQIKEQQQIAQLIIITFINNNLHET